MTPPICFVDLESTALGPLARPWEVAVIARHATAEGGDRPADIEYLWHVEYTYRSLPDGTNPEALAIGGWPERGAGLDGVVYRADVAEEGVRVAAGAEFVVARQVHELLAGVVLVGVGVHFDAAVLSAMFLRHGLDPEPWHYAIFDLKAATWGYARGGYRCGEPVEESVLLLPVRSEAIAGWLGIQPPAGEERHTALGDARWARDVYDAITKADAFYTATDEQLAEMAGQALSRFHGDAA